jgi:hypothetical protein
MLIKGLAYAIEALCALRCVCESIESEGLDSEKANGLERIIADFRLHAQRQDSPFLDGIADAIDEGLIHSSTHQSN